MKKLTMLLVLLTMTACNKQSGMQTRTYELARLNRDDALALITPYIREGGMVSGKGRLITVRERVDRFPMIEDLLKKYDGSGEALDVLLDLQVIEADGFTNQDSAVADIREQLQQTFRYRGYRLLGQTHLQVREGQGFRQNSGRDIQIRGSVDRVSTHDKEQRVPVSVELEVTGKGSLSSTVTATIGKPVILGQSVGNGAIILVIRPSLSDSGKTR